MKRLWKRLLATALGLIISMLLFEVVARVIFSRVIVYNIEMSKYASRVKRPSANPNISHEHIPLSEDHLMGVDVRINSLGYRDGEFPVEKPAGTLRVAMLGDSITFGWGVEQDATFSALVEQDLARHTSSPVEVINFGVGNYNSVQEVTAFTEKGLSLDPDYVVVNYFLNDAEPVPRRSRKAKVLERFQSIVFLWSRVNVLMYLTGQRPDAITYYNDLYVGGTAAWQAAQDALSELHRVTSERDMKLLLVIIPDLHQQDGAYPFLGVHRAVLDFAAAEGILAVDLLPYFQDTEDLTTLWVSPDDAHPNAAGHRLIATGIVDALVEKVGFPDPVH